MIRDTLLVFRTPERLMSTLSTILAGAGIEIMRDTVQWTDDGLQAELTPRFFSWWGDQLAILLHPDDGGTTVVEIVSAHRGVAG